MQQMGNSAGQPYSNENDATGQRGRRDSDKKREEKLAGIAQGACDDMTWYQHVEMGIVDEKGSKNPHSERTQLSRVSTKQITGGRHDDTCGQGA